MRKDISLIQPIVTIITPTTGKNSLFNLIESITSQEIPVMHIILWDDKRSDSFAGQPSKMKPEDLDKQSYWDEYGYMVQNIVLKGEFINGVAMGSSLRSIGMMAAKTEYVTFADDDVMWDKNHLASLLLAMNDKNWAFCKRKIWTPIDANNFECLGIDEFESVGEDAKTPYKMVDNNCMMFRRRIGTSAAVLYRETKEYNDDRLMYNFLKTHAGEPGKTNLATINQVCPKRLIDFFRHNCTKIEE